MWRSKKFILIATLAVVVLAGSIGGVVFAHDENGTDGKNEACREALLNNVCDHLNSLEGMCIEITPEQLKAAFADARSQMPDECQLPMRPGGQGAMPGRIRAPGAMGVGIFQCLVDKFDVDQDSLKAALADAKEQIKAGADRQEVMAEVLASLGIDIEELKATCTGDADSERPLKRGFRGFGGRLHGMGGPHPMP